MSWILNTLNNVVFQTVIAGVLVYALGQIIQNFVLMPIQNYRSVIGKIDNMLKFYSNITGNPGCEYTPKNIVIECSKSIRQLSCDLESCFKQLPFQDLRKKQKLFVSGSAKILIGISNNLWRVDDQSNKSPSLRNYENEQQLRINLGIEQL